MHVILCDLSFHSFLLEARQKFDWCQIVALGVQSFSKGEKHTRRITSKYLTPSNTLIIASFGCGGGTEKNIKII